VDQFALELGQPAEDG
jgi:hypothetical protein